MFCNCGMVHTSDTWKLTCFTASPNTEGLILACSRSVTFINNKQPPNTQCPKTVPDFETPRAGSGFTVTSSPATYGRDQKYQLWLGITDSGRGLHGATRKRCRVDNVSITCPGRLSKDCHPSTAVTTQQSETGLISLRMTEVDPETRTSKSTKAPTIPTGSDSQIFTPTSKPLE